MWRKSRQDNALTPVGTVTTFRTDRPPAARCSRRSACSVPTHPIRPADVALSGSAVLRAGAAVLRDRARDRARLRGTQTGRYHRPDAGSPDLESDQAHRSVHDDPAARLPVLGERRKIMLGGAKPVPVNPANYRNPKRGDIIVSLAGVFVNFLIALGCGAAVRGRRASLVASRPPRRRRWASCRR